MQILCPGCATSYKIDPVSLGAGRMVRCARCQTIWFAAPSREAGNVSVAASGVNVQADRAVQAESAPTRRRDSNNVQAGQQPDTPIYERPEAASGDEMPAAPEETTGPISVTDAPPLVPNEQTSTGEAGEEPASADIETFAARRKQLQKRRKQSRTSSRWTMVILLMVAFNVALIATRDEVVRLLPQTAPLFSAIGMPVNLRHLEFKDVQISKEVENGVTILVIAGKIAPTVNRTVAVPRLRFAARNAKGQEIHTWTSKPEQARVHAGETLPFITRLASPPRDTVDVMVRFYNENDANGPRR
jgi:predicted Zn finger-like uncharacterized protein